MPDAVPTTREALQTRLTGLHRERGEAVLAGNKFDVARIVEAEEQLSALDDAEAVEAGRRIDTAAAAEAQRRADLRALVSEREAARTAALAVAETAAKTMVEQLAAFMQLSADIAEVSTQLGRGSPIALDAHEVRTRVSLMLISALRALAPSLEYFGELEFNRLPDASELANWVAYEAKVSGRAVALLQQEDPK